jgi:pimeloyl-ACP methyl ester carboxylesterase
VLACTLFSGGERAVTSMLTATREPWYNALPHEFRELGPSYRAINPEGVKRWHDLHAQSRGDNAPLSQPTGQALTLANAAQLKMPVLLVSGDADLISPPPVARVFHKAIPGSRLIVLTECGHSAYWERPVEFNAAVLKFLGEQR